MPSSVPEGASSTVGFYSTTFKVASASAKGVAPIESTFSGCSGFSPVPATHQLSLRPPSHQGSTVSMGSSGHTTPKPSTPLDAPAAPPPPPSEPDSSTSASGMDLDKPPLLGASSIDDIGYVTLGGDANTVSEDLWASTNSLSAINNLLNWSVANKREIPFQFTDHICSSFIPLLNSVYELGLISQHLAADDEAGAKYSTLGNTMSKIISDSRIVTYTTLPEVLQTAKQTSSDAPAADPQASKGKGKVKSHPARAPSNSTRPPPAIPHSMRPSRPIPSKLASAQAEMDLRPQPWIPITNKWKAPNYEEVIIALAKTFPSTTTVLIQQAAAQIARPSS